MDRVETAARELEEVSRELAQRGQADIAVKLGEIVGTLRNGIGPRSVGEVITTDEAAEMLGVNPFAVSGWARKGILEAFNRGGRLAVSKRSVELLIDSPLVARHREWARGFDEAIRNFGASDEPVPEARNAWIGHKPWDASTADGD
jgi:hypothetical protein